MTVSPLSHNSASSGRPDRVQRIDHTEAPDWLPVGTYRRTTRLSPGKHLIATNVLSVITEGCDQDCDSDPVLK